MKLKIGKKLRTTSLNSKFTASYKKECIGMKNKDNKTYPNIHSDLDIVCTKCKHAMTKHLLQ